jgi:hypothetical protein
MDYSQSIFILTKQTGYQLGLSIQSRKDKVEFRFKSALFTLLRTKRSQVAAKLNPPIYIYIYMVTPFRKLTS